MELKRKSSSELLVRGQCTRLFEEVLNSERFEDAMSLDDFAATVQQYFPEFTTESLRSCYAEMLVLRSGESPRFVDLIAESLLSNLVKEKLAVDITDIRMEMKDRIDSDSEVDVSDESESSFDLDLDAIPTMVSMHKRKSSYLYAKTIMDNKEVARAKMHMHFVKFDDSGTGKLSFDEFQRAISSLSPTTGSKTDDVLDADTVNELFKSFGGHLTGELDYRALVQSDTFEAMIQTHVLPTVENPTLEELEIESTTASMLSEDLKMEADFAVGDRLEQLKQENAELRGWIRTIGTPAVENLKQATAELEALRLDFAETRSRESQRLDLCTRERDEEIAEMQRENDALLATKSSLMQELSTMRLVLARKSGLSVPHSETCVDLSPVSEGVQSTSLGSFMASAGDWQSTAKGSGHTKDRSSISLDSIGSDSILRSVSVNASVVDSEFLVERLKEMEMELIQSVDDLKVEREKNERLSVERDNEKKQVVAYKEKVQDLKSLLDEMTLLAHTKEATLRDLSKREGAGGGALSMRGFSAWSSAGSLDRPLSTRTLETAASGRRGSTRFALAFAADSAVDFDALAARRASQASEGWADDGLAAQLLIEAHSPTGALSDGSLSLGDSEEEEEEAERVEKKEEEAEDDVVLGKAERADYQSQIETLKAEIFKLQQAYEMVRIIKPRTLTSFERSSSRLDADLEREREREEKLVRVVEESERSLWTLLVQCMSDSRTIAFASLCVVVPFVYFRRRLWFPRTSATAQFRL